MDHEQDWNDSAAEAMERDPRNTQIGYHVGGTFVLDGTSVFVWFDSVDALLDHLKSVEPRVHDLEPGNGLEVFQSDIQPVLDAVRAGGLSSEALGKINELAKDMFQVHWWGTFDELLKGKDEFSRAILDGFLDEDGAGGSINGGEMDDFVEYLMTCRC